MTGYSDSNEIQYVPGTFVYSFLVIHGMAVGVFGQTTPGYFVLTSVATPLEMSIDVVSTDESGTGPGGLGPSEAPAAQAPSASKSSCGWDIGCQFFSGFVNLFLNNRPSGALQLAGAEAAIAAPSALGAAVAPYAPAVLSFVGAGLGRLASNPASLDFVLGAARAAVPGAAAPLSWWGLAGASAY